MANQSGRARKTNYSKQHTLYLTEQMWHTLQALSQRRSPVIEENALIREALQRYLDEQVEVIGSRRHFNQTLRQHLQHAQAQSAEQERHVVMYLRVIVHLLTFALAKLLSVHLQRAIDPQQLLTKALSDTQQEGELLDRQLRTLLGDSNPETAL